MPSIGQGALTSSYGPYRAMVGWFLAAYVSSAQVAPPSAKLGSAAPDAAWTQAGLLKDDDFTVSQTDKTLLEDRRGFSNNLFNLAVQQAGEATFTAAMVETDPASLAALTGDSEDTITSGGDSLDVSLDTISNMSVLFYAFNAWNTSEERYIYIPHGQIEWVLDKGDNGELIATVNVHALRDTVSASTYAYQLGRFD